VRQLVIKVLNIIDAHEVYMPKCFGHPQPSSGIKVHNLNPKWTCAKITQFKTQVVSYRSIWVLNYAL